MNQKSIDTIASLPSEKKIVKCIDAYLITTDKIPKISNAKVYTNKYRSLLWYIIAVIASFLLGFCINQLDTYINSTNSSTILKGEGSDSDNNRYEFNINTP